MFPTFSALNSFYKNNFIFIVLYYLLMRKHTRDMFSKAIGLVGYKNSLTLIKYICILKVSARPPWSTSNRLSNLKLLNYFCFTDQLGIFTYKQHRNSHWRSSSSLCSMRDFIFTMNKYGRQPARFLNIFHVPSPPPPYIIHKYNIENVLWQKKNDAIRLNFAAHVHPALSLYYTKMKNENSSM